jgi:hypothetical protein
MSSAEQAAALSVELSSEVLLSEVALLDGMLSVARPGPELTLA